MSNTLNRYNEITSSDLSFFQSIVGAQNCLTGAQDLHRYASDHTEDFLFYPQVALLPQTVEQIAQILKYCNQRLIPVTPRGAGTGLSGGSLPVAGGVSLSLEKFNRILKIDTQNLQAIVEPGVVNEAFQNEVKQYGLYYPPDPASKGSCFLGGNIAHGSGGPKAVKYGVTKDYVLNLEVVLADGSVIWTGANVLKNSTGYNLTQLMVGSEGTLGIVTKIVFKLIPLPLHTLVMLVPFPSAEFACAAVAKVFVAGIVPSGLEFMERDALLFAQQYTGESFPEISADTMAHLLIELDGNDPTTMMQEAEKIAEIMSDHQSFEILFADTELQKEKLWKLRRKVGEAVKSQTVYKEEDTVVPRANLPQLLKGVKEIGRTYGFQSVCYGHAGDGNLHVNIIKGTLSDEQWKKGLGDGITKIFELCVALGGTISGEHGIGWVQKDYLPIALSATSINLQKAIKKAFDTNGILNPQKIFIQ